MTKEYQRGQKRNWAKTVTLLLCAVLGLGYIGLKPKPEPTPLPEGRLEVHFIDVGQGDATLIRCGDEAMLIDGGTEQSGTALQLYLRQQGITALKYVVATHPDSDHIGGLATVLYNFETDMVLMTDRTADTAAYDNLMHTMQDRGYAKTVPATGRTYRLGEAEFTILGPLSRAEESNNESLALRLVFGSVSFLFCGDAEAGEEGELALSLRSLHSTVYKVNHHGSNSSSCWPFLLRVRPQYAVISCGRDNDYGHPDAAVLERLATMGAAIRRTDREGTLIAVSDGQTLEWRSSYEETQD